MEKSRSLGKASKHQSVKESLKLHFGHSNFEGSTGYMVWTALGTAGLESAVRGNSSDQSYAHTAATVFPNLGTRGDHGGTITKRKQVFRDGRQWGLSPRAETLSSRCRVAQVTRAKSRLENFQNKQPSFFSKWKRKGWT